MAKFTAALLASLVATASAFVSKAPAAASTKTALQAKAGVWDPLGLYTLGNGKAFDTFPNVFPNEQFLEAAEIKHGRQAMLAWTGVWATTQVRDVVPMHSMDSTCTAAFITLGWLRYRLLEPHAMDLS
jgi:Chlorophyll A-B binding protein